MIENKLKEFQSAMTAIQGHEFKYFRINFDHYENVKKKFKKNLTQLSLPKHISVKLEKTIFRVSCSQVSPNKPIITEKSFVSRVSRSRLCQNKLFLL